MINLFFSAPIPQPPSPEGEGGDRRVLRTLDPIGGFAPEPPYEELACALNPAQEAINLILCTDQNLLFASF